MNKFLAIIISAFVALSLNACQYQPDSDEVQRQQAERIISEATSQTGMPAIKNFRERKLLKDIIELRDQEGIATYTYLVSEQTGRVGDLLCVSVGYGIPAATQYTNPERVESLRYGITLPQADPNSLFSPSAAEGTWVMCLDEKKGKTVPVYIEPRIVVSPFALK